MTVFELRDLAEEIKGSQPLESQVAQGDPGQRAVVAAVLLVGAEICDRLELLKTEITALEDEVAALK